MDIAEEKTVDESELNIEEEVIDSVTESDEQVKTTDSEDEEESTGETESDDETSSDDLEEVTISIDEESLPQETSLPKHLRKTIKEKDKKLKESLRKIEELEKKVNATLGVESKPTLGKKPNIEDFDYDDAKYDEAYSNWYEQKQEVKKQEESQRAVQNKEQEDWQARLDTYSVSKSKLKVSNFDDAEYNAQEKLSTTQQAIIIKGAKNPADIMYVLGSYPNKLDEMSKIKDPVEFSFAIAKLETKLKKTVKRTPTTKPERTLTSSSGASVGSSQLHLDKLREKAAKTGDYSEVMAYKRKNK